VPEDEARVSIRNRGFLYGDGGFETIRIHRGAPFRIDAHFTRLLRSLDLLRIDSAWSIHELRQGAKKIVEENRVADGLLRITITAPEGLGRLGTATITSRELPKIPDRPALHLATSVRRVIGPLSQSKSIARAAESTALREAQAEGAFDAVLLNDKGRVAETTARNLFCVAGGTLRTPGTYEGALAGITRGAIVEIAARSGAKVRESSLTVPQLQRAEEVFLTGSGVGVLGIASLDGHRFPYPGTTTTALRKSYADALEAESRW